MTKKTQRNENEEEINVAINIKPIFQDDHLEERSKKKYF
jgi:hypothetical protein